MNTTAQDSAQRILFNVNRHQHCRREIFDLIKHVDLRRNFLRKFCANGARAHGDHVPLFASGGPAKMAGRQRGHEHGNEGWIVEGRRPPTELAKATLKAFEWLVCQANIQ